MSKKMKVWILTATSLIVLGLSVFIAVMTVYHWDFTKLSTATFETNTYPVSEEFSHISMKTDTADILFSIADDGICRVVCYEMKNAKHSVVVQDGTLAVRVVDERQWYEYIGININTPNITVYLPEAEYASLFIEGSTGDIEMPEGFACDNVDISTSTGAIRVDGLSAETLDLSVSTGDITVSNVTCEGVVTSNVSTGKTKLTDITCKSVISSGDTGDITLKNVIAVETFSIERDTGDVKFDGCDAAEIFVKTDTGDVKGSLLTDKVFIVQTDTGCVDVPKTVTGGKCEITTSTGDIHIRIP